MDKRIRWVVLVLSILVIISMSILVVVNKDSWFVTKTKITYPDGCIEEYKGTVITTDECTEGRRIAEEQKLGRKQNYTPVFDNIPVFNIT
jgi:hypothetical protein